MANLVLVDSSVWIDHFNGAVNPQVEWLHAALEGGEEDILGGDLITQEVLQGFRLDNHFSQAERALALFPCVTLGGRENCIAAATMYRRLRHRCITIRKPVDVLVAVTSQVVEHRVPLAGVLRGVEISKDDGMLAEIVMGS